MSVVLSSAGITPEEVAAVAAGRTLTWAADLAGTVGAGQAAFDRVLAGGARIYGVTTEVAGRSSFDVPTGSRGAYQIAMLRSHACGTGPLLDRHAARAAWVTKAASLAAGRAGCSLALLTALTDVLNRGLAPAVPVTGSLAASGDLVPSAHAGLPLLGEGDLLDESGDAVPAGPLLAACGLHPLTPGPRDGLSLVNGTSVTAALAALSLLDAERLVTTADVLAAAGVEVRRGHRDAFAQAIVDARPHPGALRTADTVELVLGAAETARRESGRSFHDAYAWRCVPQVHGAVHDALVPVRAAVSTELRSCTDNPILDGDSIVSGGNFHGAPLGIPLDSATTAMTVLAGLSRQRLVGLMSSPGLPKSLVGAGGNFGLGMLVTTVTAHVLQLSGLVPASTRWLPVDEAEDHVANATVAAFQLRTALDGVRHVLAAEAIAIAAAADLSDRPAAGPALRAVHALTRRTVAPPGPDRAMSVPLTELAPHIHELAALPDSIRRPV
jgi:histidine ammonia-lyase